MILVVTRPYSAVSAEDRLHDRRRRLVTAAVELMSEHGVGGLTVRTVAAEAGLSPRYVYESFADLDDLRVRAFDDIAAEIQGRMLAAVIGAPAELRDQGHAVIGELLAYADEFPQRARLALTGSFGHPDLAGRRQSMARFISDAVATHLRPHVPERVSGDQLALAARLAFGAMAELIVARLDGEAIVADPGVADGLIERFVDALDAFSASN